MKIIFTGSEIQQIPSIAFALHRMGHEVAIYPKPAEKVEENEEEEKALREFLKNNNIDFVISNVFTRAIAEITYALQMKYAVYGMDSPMYATYFPEISHYDNCYLFYFDRKEYQMLKERGYTNIYYLPLAADIRWAENFIVTDKDIKKYRSDISFVGSLYTKNVYDKYAEKLPDKLQDIFGTIMEKSALVWDGRDRVGECITPELVQVVRKICPEVFGLKYDMPDEYYLRQWFFARKMTQIERTLLLQILAEYFDLRLYTWEDETVPQNVKRYKPVDSMKESLKVFYASKINLNITLRSIETGLPARIFDVMSVGGFVLSNWQEEIPDLFEENKEIVTFKTPEEMIEKTDYYLKHDKERKKIGINAYKKVKQCYTYEQQMEKIISILFPNSK